MVVRESAPRITPSAKVMAMLGKERGQENVEQEQPWGWWRGAEGAYIEVPRLEEAMISVYNDEDLECTAYLTSPVFR